MRTALCISGHLRSFLNVYQYIKEKIIDPMQCDIFIHTWSTLGGEPRPEKGDADGIAQQIDIGEVYRIVKPLSLIVESEDSKLKFVEATKNIIVPSNQQCFIAGKISHHIAMFYSIYKSNQLKCDFEKLNNFKYDRVIRFRGDIRMGTLFEYNMFPSDDVLYIPKIGRYVENGANDQIAIASSQIMDVYADLYHEIINYYDSGTVVRRPEAILKHYLDSKNIKIEELDLDYDIYRLDNTIVRQSVMLAHTLEVRWR